MVVTKEYIDKLLLKRDDVSKISRLSDRKNIVIVTIPENKWINLQCAESCIDLTAINLLKPENNLTFDCHLAPENALTANKISANSSPSISDNILTSDNNSVFDIDNNDNYNGGLN